MSAAHNQTQQLHDLILLLSTEEVRSHSTGQAAFVAFKKEPAETKQLFSDGASELVIGSYLTLCHRFDQNTDSTHGVATIRSLAASFTKCPSLMRLVKCFSNRKSFMTNTDKHPPGYKFAPLFSFTSG